MMATYSTYQQELLHIIDDISFIRQITEALKQENLLKEEYTSLEKIEQQAITLLEALYGLQHGSHRVNVAVVGSFSAGKSSFINSLLGAEVCPIGVHPTTSSVTTFYYADNIQIFQEIPNKKDAITLEEYHRRVKKSNSQRKEDVPKFSFFYPFDGFRDIELVDTPGFDNKENEYDTQITLDATKKADVIFFIFDANLGEIGQSVWQTLEKIKSSNRAYWYAFINKADTKPSSALEKIKSRIQERYGRFFSDVQAYSAQKALEQQEKSRHQLVQKISRILDSTIQNFTDQTSLSKTEEPSTEIHIHATGKKSYMQFKITYDVNQAELVEIYQPQRQSYISRDRIIEVLKQIAEQKNQIAAKNFNEMSSNYERALIDLQELPQKLSRAIQKIDSQQNRQRIESLFAEIQRVYSENIKAFSELIIKETFTIQPIPKQRKSYVFDPYYEISFNKLSYEVCWKDNKYIWKQVADGLIEIIEAAEKDLRVVIGKEKKNIFEKINDILNEDKQKILDELRNIKNFRIMDSYDYEQDARGAFLSYVKPYEAESRTILLTSILDFCSELKQDVSEKIGVLKESASSKQQKIEGISKKIEYFLQKRGNRRLS